MERNLIRKPKPEWEINVVSRLRTAAKETLKKNKTVFIVKEKMGKKFGIASFFKESQKQSFQGVP